MRNNSQKDPGQRRMDARLERYIRQDPELRYAEELKQANDRQRRRQILIEQQRRAHQFDKLVNTVACGLGAIVIALALMFIFICRF